MMQNEIIVDVRYGEKRVALLEDKELVEVYIERQNAESIVGNIYKGIVENMLPGMDAAFINIGMDKNAFLYLGDMNEIQFHDNDDIIEINQVPEALRIGQEVVVQVIKEGSQQKGPRVSLQITIAGRYLVLLPNTDYIGVSKRIENEEEKERLKKIAYEIRPEGMGIIVRTVAEGKDINVLKKDLDFILNIWWRVKQKNLKSSAPTLLYKDLDITLKAVRDIWTNEVDRFVINDRSEYNKIVDFLSNFAPHLKTKVEYFNLSANIFEYFQIEQKILKALSKKIWLKSGGYIVIDQTEALTVIDVNTGKYTGKNDVSETILKTNLEAALEIAKQIRLRDIGGIIIIDFIDMKNIDHQKLILDTLKEAVKKDKTKVVVVGITPLGLVEMTRKKIRQRLSLTMTEECKTCEGKGFVISKEEMAFRVLNELEWYCKNKVERNIYLEISREVCNVLRKDDINKIRELEKRFGKKVFLKVSHNMPVDKFKIECINDRNHYMALCGALYEGDEVMVTIEEINSYNSNNANAYINHNRIEVENSSDLIDKTVQVRIEKVYSTDSKGKIIEVFEDNNY